MNVFEAFLVPIVSRGSGEEESITVRSPKALSQNTDTEVFEGTIKNKESQIAYL